LESRFDFSGLRDVIGQVTTRFIRFSISHFLLVVFWNQASISKRFNGECDAMVDMTLNDF